MCNEPRKSILIGFGFFLLAASCTPTPMGRSILPPLERAKIPPSGSPLRAFAEFRGIHIGTSAERQLLDLEPPYAQTLSREFNMLTPRFAMKFGPLRPTRQYFRFWDADRIVDFAEANGMQVRGHTLVWHRVLPRWLTEGKFSQAELVAILREHILTVVARYKGRMVAWDVVNEAISDDGSLRDTIWLRGIGSKYIDLAFQWAHEADPGAQLFYNDYGGEGLNRKSDAIYRLVRGLQKRGVPIHGVGLQLAIALESSLRGREVAANMNRLASLGLKVQITEMDVRIRRTVTERDLAEQARIYGDMLGACLSTPNCTAFLVWDFTDCHSRTLESFPGCDPAMIFDASYHPKPAYHALIDVLAGR
jgi:endo-1,4-beta-xylanase